MTKKINIIPENQLIQSQTTPGYNFIFNFDTKNNLQKVFFTLLGVVTNHGFAV